MSTPAEHAFVRNPHRTLIALSVPVLVSLVAEPLTGLADTAFVARLGALPMAALGVGTVVLSGSFWVFNFLGIGTQTEVAQALGREDPVRAREQTGLALVLALLFGVLLAAGGLAAGPVARLMGAEGSLEGPAATYLRIRLLAAPAVLVMTVGFGALRGLQDMRSPLWIAVLVNALNIGLCAVLIFGLGPVPRLGVAGAAWATAFSQTLGALGALLMVRRRLGLSRRFDWRGAARLLTVGRDLFLRTGLLTLFLLLTTRAATRIGAEAGAAHQAVRQVWVFTALLLDAWAATGQSLVGYFMGAGLTAMARRVAAVTCAWSLGTGVLLTAAMLAGEHLVAALLVPESARALFAAAWMMSALFQPLNALSFATDGLHWGTGDYRYLRNAMVAATGSGIVALLFVDEGSPGALTRVWLATGGWIFVRSLFGLIRIWPGIGRSPFRTAPAGLSPRGAARAGGRGARPAEEGEAEGS